MTEQFQRISISLDDELVKDINFDMMKQHGIKEPKNSYGTYFYNKLRDRVPHRNSKEDENASED